MTRNGLLGIDLGTTAVKVGLFAAEDGRISLGLQAPGPNHLKDVLWISFDLDGRGIRTQIALQLFANHDRHGLGKAQEIAAVFLAIGENGLLADG